MSTTYGGKGCKGRAAVSGERPIGAASCRLQHNQVYISHSFGFHMLPLVEGGHIFPQSQTRMYVSDV